MTEESREDIPLLIQLMAEGVRYHVKGTAGWDPPPEAKDPAHPVVILDETGERATTWPYPRSRIDFFMDGDNVTISEAGKVLATGKLEPRAPWRDEVLSDGTPVDDVFRGTTTWSDIAVSHGCHTVKEDKACKFCIFSSFGDAEWPLPSTGPYGSFDEIVRKGERQIEATSIAVKHGWRGLILFVGGATPLDRRDQWTTDLFERYMAKFHEFLDDDLLSQLAIHSYVYPPDDLGQMAKWKRLGINVAKYDCQIMDPAYFKAICPGRGSQKRWFEAQEAAVEVFGRGGCTGTVVAGLEPMAGMLEGIEERVSKGVHIRPNIFYPIPGTPLEGMRPATAEWYVEAFTKTNEIYERHP